MKNQEINIILVSPKERPELITVKNSREETLSLIGGTIDTSDAIYPTNDDPVVIIRDLGEKDWIVPNRVYNGDILTGNFIIAGIDRDGEMEDLSEKMIIKYFQLFYNPVSFIPPMPVSVSPQYLGGNMVDDEKIYGIDQIYNRLGINREDSFTAKYRVGDYSEYMFTKRDPMYLATKLLNELGQRGMVAIVSTGTAIRVVIRDDTIYLGTTWDAQIVGEMYRKLNLHNIGLILDIGTYKSANVISIY